MKQGTNFHLAVQLDIDLNLIEKIEFIFLQNDNNYYNDFNPFDKMKYENNQKITNEYKKISNYPGDVELHPTQKNTLLIPFSQEETFYFEDIFYMDTRITMKNSKDQPETPIVTLRMNPTLFE